MLKGKERPQGKWPQLILIVIIIAAGVIVTLAWSVRQNSAAQADREAQETQTTQTARTASSAIDPDRQADAGEAGDAADADGTAHAGDTGDASGAAETSDLPDAASTTDASGKSTAALIDALKQIEAQPDKAENYEAAADLYVQQSQYAKAIQILQSGYAATGQTQLRNKITSVRMQQARNASGAAAEKLWKQIIADDPKVVDAYSSLADLYIAEEQYQEALDILQEGAQETKDALLVQRVSTLKKEMEEQGLSGSDLEGNPAQELAEALWAGYYNRAIRIMARKEFQDVVSAKAAQADAKGRITIDETDFPEAVADAAAGGADTSEGAADAAAGGADTSEGAADAVTGGTDTSEGAANAVADGTATSKDADDAATDSSVTRKDAGGTDHEVGTSEDAGNSSADEADTSEGTDEAAGHTHTDELTEATPQYSIQLTLDAENHQFSVTATDQTRITENWPAITDEKERVVIGTYGETESGFGKYVLADGTEMTAAAYFASLAP